MTHFSPLARPLTGLVVLLLLVPGATIPLNDEEELREFHNRTLARWPAGEAFLPDPAAYFEGASNWVSDRVGPIVAASILQSRIRFYLLATPPQRRVTLGKSGFVFLNGASEQAVNGVFDLTCIQSHTPETHVALQQALSKLARYGRKIAVPIHVVVTPMTPTIYADFLPRSVPRAIREACLTKLRGENLMTMLAKDESRFIYPFTQMQAQRDDYGFFPMANFHPMGRSLQVIRDDYLRKAGIRVSTEETLLPTTSQSEILGAYGIRAQYPVYVIHNSDISLDEEANSRLNAELRDFRPRHTSVYVNAGDDASKTALMLSDSVGNSASLVFASAFKRLLWVNANSIRETDISEVIDRVVSMEHFDTMIMLVHEGGVSSVISWANVLEPDR